MNDMPLTVEAVDTFIGARHRGLTFPSWLERQLEHDLHFIPASGLVVGRRQDRDCVDIAPRRRYAVDLAYGMVQDGSPKLPREGLAASIPVAIVLQILVSFVLNATASIWPLQREPSTEDITGHHSSYGSSMNPWLSDQFPVLRDRHGDAGAVLSIGQFDGLRQRGPAGASELSRSHTVA